MGGFSIVKQNRNLFLTLLMLPSVLRSQVFQKLLKDESFVDVTLVCPGEISGGGCETKGYNAIKAHKVSESLANLRFTLYTSGKPQGLRFCPSIFTNTHFQILKRPYLDLDLVKMDLGLNRNFHLPNSKNIPPKSSRGSRSILDWFPPLLPPMQVVLSSASPFFKRLLLENPCRHPIVILPSGVELRDLETIVEFVYGGEVEIAADRVDAVLREDEDELTKHTAENPSVPPTSETKTIISFIYLHESAPGRDIFSSCSRVLCELNNGNPAERRRSSRSRDF